MQRKVEFGDGQSGVVSANEPLLRYGPNPILSPRHVNEVWTDPARQVVTVHNAGVATVAGETVMLFRSHLRSGVSVIGLARSRDGLTGWRIEPRPFLAPFDAASGGAGLAAGLDPAVIAANEAGGVEDARINPVEDGYAITYSAYAADVPNRVRVQLATTTDFASVTRYGPMLGVDMRNVVLFGERFGGRYAALFRPNDELPGDTGGIFREIRLGYSADYRGGSWDIADEPVMRTPGGPSAFSDKIGPGAPPVRTRHGWLNVFHGVRATMDGHPYVLGVALHDLDDPARVAMSRIPILFPSRADCRVEESDYVHVPNVVFCCGVLRRPDGTLLIYYGGNDTVMNVAISHEDVLVELCRQYGQDPATGRALPAGAW